MLAHPSLAHLHCVLAQCQCVCVSVSVEVSVYRVRMWEEVSVCKCKSQPSDMPSVCQCLPSVNVSAQLRLRAFQACTALTHINLGMPEPDAAHPNPYLPDCRFLEATCKSASRHVKQGWWSTTSIREDQKIATGLRFVHWCHTSPKLQARQNPNNDPTVRVYQHLEDQLAKAGSDTEDILALTTTREGATNLRNYFSIAEGKCRDGSQGGRRHG